MQSNTVRRPPNLRKLARIRSTLLSWYRDNARQFLWRASDVDPYMTLISEVMLQQTQTARVTEKLPTFLTQFPTIQHLAQAGNADIIRAWQGMGYNNRALRLRDCARAVVERHGGRLPRDKSTLLELPGIGPYTASAIAAFAFGADLPVIDINVRRVYTRLFWNVETTAMIYGESRISAIAEQIYPTGKAPDWHQAIMDIGALYCTARSPRCAVCPLAKICASANNMRAETPPKRTEPSYMGQPNRIWRGRIVELLRAIPPDKYLSMQEILDALFPPALFEPESRERCDWLHMILTGLEKDRIIAILPDKNEHPLSVQLQR